jgi:hypothetical protein
MRKLCQTGKAATALTGLGRTDGLYAVDRVVHLSITFALRPRNSPKREG